MRSKLPIVAAALAAALAVPTGPSAAQDIPCNTARLIVPWGAGGGTDVIFRTFVEAANKAGADPQLQVVNIPGQGGNKGAKEARAAKADGCTLFAIHQSALSSYLTGRVDFTFDAFEPVSLLTRTPPIYGAHPSTPYNTVKELVAYAKEHPGEVNVGATLGSTSHFWYLILADRTGVEFNYVSYDGTRERMTALLANTINTGEINLAAAKQYITSNELKALGIATAERDPRIPNVPTLKEQGYDLVMGTDRGIVLPKGTSDAVIDHYASVFKQAAEDPEVKAQMEAKGTLVNYLGPDEYKAYFEETFADWESISKKVGLYNVSS